MAYDDLSSLIKSEPLLTPQGLTSLATVRLEQRLPWRPPEDWEQHSPAAQRAYGAQFMTPSEWRQAEQKLNNAIMILNGFYPFFGMLFSQMQRRRVWIDTPQKLAKIGADFRTLATDGHWLYVWPFFPSHATMRELLAAILHELFHNLHAHPYRVRGKRNDLAQMAADYVVNLMVNDTARSLYNIREPMNPRIYSKVPWMIRTEIQPFDKQLTNPTEADLAAGRATQFYVDERFRGMTFEQVYDILNQECDASGAAGLMSQGALVNDHSHWKVEGRPAADDGEVNEADLTPQQVRELVMDAYVRCDKSMIGTLPGALQRQIEQWLHPPLPWQRLLTIYMKNAPGDVGWCPGDLRFSEPMPWVIEEPKLSYATFGFDLSGSMSDQEIAASIANAKAILRGYPQMRGYAIFWDHDVHEVIPLDDFDGQITRGVTGGGGTSIAPQFAKIKELGIEKDVAVHCCFTDGEVYWNEVDPGSLPYPCLWVITNDRPSCQPPKHRNYRSTVLIRGEG